MANLLRSSCTSACESSVLDGFLARRDALLERVAQKYPSVATALRSLPVPHVGAAAVVSVWLCVFGTTRAITLGAFHAAMSSVGELLFINLGTEFQRSNVAVRMFADIMDGTQRQKARALELGCQIAAAGFMTLGFVFNVLHNFRREAVGSLLLALLPRSLASVLGMLALAVTLAQVALAALVGDSSVPPKVYARLNLIQTDVAHCASLLRLLQFGGAAVDHDDDERSFFPSMLHAGVIVAIASLWLAVALQGRSDAAALSSAGADDDGGGDVADAVVSAPDSAAKDRTTARSRAAPGVEEA